MYSNLQLAYAKVVLHNCGPQLGRSAWSTKLQYLPGFPWLPSCPTKHRSYRLQHALSSAEVFVELELLTDADVVRLFDSIKHSTSRNWGISLKVKLEDRTLFISIKDISCSAEARTSSHLIHRILEVRLDFPAQLDPLGSIEGVVIIASSRPEKFCYRESHEK